MRTENLGPCLREEVQTLVRSQKAEEEDRRIQRPVQARGGVRWSRKRPVHEQRSVGDLDDRRPRPDRRPELAGHMVSLGDNQVGAVQVPAQSRRIRAAIIVGQHVVSGEYEACPGAVADGSQEAHANRLAMIERHPLNVDDVIAAAVDPPQQAQPVEGDLDGAAGQAQGPRSSDANGQVGDPRSDRVGRQEVRLQVEGWACQLGQDAIRAQRGDQAARSSTASCRGGPPQRPASWPIVAGVGQDVGREVLGSRRVHHCPPASAARPQPPHPSEGARAPIMQHRPRR